MVQKVPRLLREWKGLYLPGVIVFAVLFLAGNAMNFSLSYMGNTNESVALQIIKTFWWKILFLIIKVIVVYCAAGAVLGALFVAALSRIRERSGLLRGKYSVSIAASAFLVLYIFLQFSYKLIIDPQMYLENFSVHASIFQGYQDFLADHVHPLVPGIAAWGMIVLALAIVLWSVDYRARWRALASKFRRSRTVIIVPALLGVLVTVGVLYETKMILYRTDISSPNILILSSDAVRPDHLGVNGYGRDTTPNIDRLARMSLQHRGVLTALPRTFPAWVSFFTSQYPLTHEIRHMFPRSRERNVPFDSAAGVLGDKGYHTAVISDFAGDIFPRIEMGIKKVSAPTFNFDTLLRHMILEKQTFLLPFVSNRLGDIIFPEMRGLARYSHHDAVTRETIGEIESCRGNPFFITAFYSVTHFPYAAPWPYYKKYADPGYRGPYRYYKQVVIQMGDGAGAAPAEDSEDDKRQVIALYDGALNLLDREIGRVLDYLRDNGLLENTIVVFTSDHGENLYDRDLGMGHGEHLRGLPALEIPFILCAPRLKDRAGTTAHRFSSAIDIMPTVFDAAGLERPAFFQGKSLLRAADGREAAGVDAYCETGLWFDYNRMSPLFFHHNRISYPDVTGLMELDMSYRNELVIAQKFQNITNAAKYRSIISGQYKLIYLPLPGGSRFELYDQYQDPYNERDLSKERPAVAARMKKMLFDFIEEKSSGNFIINRDFLYPVFSDPVF
jgi:arylsulfatase A-like enzyme/uncharacterized membrane protein